MSKVISISDEVYPIDDILKDLEESKDNIKDLAVVTVCKDGTAFVIHTGLSFMHLALACKLMDKEFNSMVELAEELKE